MPVCHWLVGFTDSINVMVTFNKVRHCVSTA